MFFVAAATQHQECADCRSVRRIACEGAGLAVSELLEEGFQEGAHHARVGLGQRRESHAHDQPMLDRQDLLPGDQVVEHGAAQEGRGVVKTFGFWIKLQKAAPFWRKPVSAALFA